MRKTAKTAMCRGTCPHFSPSGPSTSADQGPPSDFPLLMAAVPPDGCVLDKLGNGHRIESIDLLRGAAALAVTWYHLSGLPLLDDAPDLEPRLLASYDVEPGTMNILRELRLRSGNGRDFNVCLRVGHSGGNSSRLRRAASQGSPCTLRGKSQMEAGCRNSGTPYRP